MEISCTTTIGFPFRPIGFKPSNGKVATLEELRKWKEKEKPNIIQEQSLLTLGGEAVTVIGLVASLVGYKKDSTLGKWFGGILAIIGVSLASIGIINSPDIKKCQKEYKEKIASATINIRNEALPTTEREDAIGLLIYSGEAQALETVINFINDTKLKDSKNTSLRNAALSHLCTSDEIQKEKKEEILLNRLKDVNEEKDTRKTALNLLRNIGDRNTINSLEEIKQTTDADLSSRIDLTIEYINNRLSGYFEKRNEQLKNFESAKTDEEKLAQSISYIKDKTLLPSCRRDVIIGIIPIIERNESPELIEYLVSTIMDKTDDYDVRSGAVTALKDANKASHNERLLEFLRVCVSDKSEHSYLRWKAIETLSKFEKEKAGKYLLLLLDDLNDNKTLISIAIRELGEHGDENIIERLESFKKSVFSQEHAGLHYDICQAIGKIRKRLPKTNEDSKN